ncbi:MAG: UDP-N-acetylmuramoyl-L-alanine--D-glutamate ligase [Firmicutes bacterium]|nr:UDP-N-acetylmuramoyl-L-alanine--D-glutamate ligase [Bacillota bacterium]
MHPAWMDEAVADGSSYAALEQWLGFSPLQLQGVTVGLLGLGESNKAALHALHQRGARLLVHDDHPFATWSQALPEGVEAVSGSLPVEALRLLVKSPGIPYTHPTVRRAMQAGLPVVTELELGFWWSQAPIIGITGTNGKTTTTTLVGAMLERAEEQVAVCGNIGIPLLTATEQLPQEGIAVVECSSFQLQGTLAFRPAVATLLNLSEAHLDYHGSFEAYRAAKMKIFANQTNRQLALLNARQWESTEAEHLTRAHLAFFGRPIDGFPSAWEQEGQLYVALPEGPVQHLLARAELRLRGAHNVENALAAALLALLAGAPLEAVAQTLRDFHGVPHRLEEVSNSAGHAIYNDAKATNPQAAMVALTSVDPPIVWIAGGLDRGDDFDPLLPVLQKRVRAAYLYGETKETLAELCQRAGIETVVIGERLVDVLPQALRSLRQGETLLYSPGCASWDQYHHFEERGEEFKRLVSTWQSQ